MSESPLGTPGRWLRAGVFCLAMTVLAMTAHLVVGGQLPSPGGALLAGLFVGCATYPVTRRDRSFRAIVATTVAAQAALHLAFAVPMVGPDVASARTGPGDGAHMVMQTGPSGVSIDRAWSALTADSPSPAMLAAHAAAAVVLALGLYRGERALLDVAAAARAFFGVLAAIVTGRLEPVAVAASIRPVVEVVDAAGAWFGDSLRGRAPPMIWRR